MRMGLFVAATLVGVALSPCRADDKKPGDGERLVGKWKVVEAVRDGEILKDVPPLVVEQFRFGGPGLSVRLQLPAKLVPADDLTAAYVEVDHLLDPEADPKRITLGRGWGGKGFRYPGIYELDGDGLRLCLTLKDWYSHAAPRVRPDKFEAPKGSGRTLVTFERVKE